MIYQCQLGQLGPASKLPAPGADLDLHGHSQTTQLRENACKCLDDRPKPPRIATLPHQLGKGTALSTLPTTHQLMTQDILSIPDTENCFHQTPPWCVDFLFLFTFASILFSCPRSFACKTSMSCQLMFIVVHGHGATTLDMDLFLFCFVLLCCACFCCCGCSCFSYFVSSQQFYRVFLPWHTPKQKKTKQNGYFEN